MHTSRMSRFAFVVVALAAGCGSLEFGECPEAQDGLEDSGMCGMRVEMSPPTTAAPTVPAALVGPEAPAVPEAHAPVAAQAPAEAPAPVEVPAPAPAPALAPVAAPAPIAAPAPAPAPVAAAPAPAAAPASDDATASLKERERVLADEYYAARAARSRSMALATALAAWSSARTPESQQAAQEAHAQYKGDAVLQQVHGVALDLTLALEHVTPELQDRLRAEEQALAERATALQSARKANVALVSALQQVARDGGTAKSRDAASKARTVYESSEGALPRGQ